LGRVGSYTGIGLSTKGNSRQALFPCDPAGCRVPLVFGGVKQYSNKLPRCTRLVVGVEEVVEEALAVGRVVHLQQQLRQLRLGPRGPRRRAPDGGPEDVIQG